jgi:cyclase
MLPARVIPCLLLRHKALVKTVQFKNPSYVGDPANTVRIFNEKEVDELVLLDITAGAEGRRPNFKLIGAIAGECFMPLAYGGGITDIDDLRELFRLGVEKVLINSAAVACPELIREAAHRFGSQAVVGSVDVRRSWLGRYEVYIRGGTQRTRQDPVTYVTRLVELGVGEVLLTSIDQDGMMSGYDLDLLKRVSSAVRVPVIASGGAGSITDLVQAVQFGGASAVSAGSLFVYQGRNRAVLINFPTRQELETAFDAA